MQKFLWCFLGAVTIHFTLRAQEAPIYTINAGEIVTSIIPIKEQYLYGEFQQGTVWFRNGRSLSALLNYNHLYGEMQFINSKGDTLALVEENSLKNIDINEDVFYHVTKNGFVEVITAHLPVKLARKQNLELIKIKVKLVGMNNSHFFSYRKVYTQETPGELQLAKQTSYYFIDQNERVHQAKKSTLLKLFGRHKKAIEDYIDTNQVDFTQEEDLKKLFAFCAQWTNK
jgi:hypothetical protein